jgi:hypothetical protein
VRSYVDQWPDDLPVPTFGPRMVCTRCGIIGADARPNWQEQPQRESLTGLRLRCVAAGPGWRLLTGMGKRPQSPAGDPMTLGIKRANGVRSLGVSCWQCHHRAILSADPWPGHVPVPSFGPRMVCTRCGIIGAEARPNWREQPARLSGAGTAPWR